MNRVLTYITETECLLGGRVSVYNSVRFKSIKCLNIRITFVKFVALSAGKFSEPCLTLRESAVSTVVVPK